MNSAARRSCNNHNTTVCNWNFNSFFVYSDKLSISPATEATSSPDMKRKRWQINGFGNVPLYVLLFIFTIREKKVKMASGGELYVELC